MIRPSSAAIPIKIRMMSPSLMAQFLPDRSVIAVYRDPRHRRLMMMASVMALILVHKPHMSADSRYCEYSEEGESDY